MLKKKLREEQWSPEQISRHLKKNPALPQASHETIYQHVYRDKKAGGDLHTLLRHKVKSYRKRSSGREKRGRIRNPVSIEERPAIVEERSRLGDWEIDTVVGWPGGAVLVTMVERKSRLLRLRLAPGKEAIAVTGAIIDGLKADKEDVHTLTYDNGKEFARHELIADLLEAEGYFAHPVRQYFPKGGSFDDFREERVIVVENLINTRIRRCLDWRTPEDIFQSDRQPPPVALAP